VAHLVSALARMGRGERPRVCRAPPCPRTRPVHFSLRGRCRAPADMPSSRILCGLKGALPRRSKDQGRPSHQLASHCDTLRLASPDHNGFQSIAGHFAGVGEDHRAVAHRCVRSGWQVNHQSARITDMHRHMVTLGIAKDHVAGQSVRVRARCTPGSFEDSIDCPRSTRR
jgi:hypothetical protein